MALMTSERDHIKLLVVAGALLAFLIVVGRVSRAQTPLASPAPAASKWIPSEVQQLRLQHAQDEAKLAQKDMVNFCGGQGTIGQYQEAFQRTMLALSAMADTIRKDNKWPDTLRFDPNTMTFTEPPPPVKPALPTDEKGNLKVDKP